MALKLSASSMNYVTNFYIAVVLVFCDYQKQNLFSFMTVSVLSLLLFKNK